MTAIKQRINFVFIIALFFNSISYSQTYEIDAVNGQNITTCSGTFYDSGGSGDDYEDDENYSVTFISSNGNPIQINFTSWNVENNANCDWDGLRIYDGVNSSATLIGTYCTNSPGTITSTNTSNALHFEFYSDFSVVEEGWVATISCVTPPIDRCTVAATVGTPTSNDTDGDGINDVCDLDDDNDGILDTDEIDCGYNTNIALVDGGFGGLSDGTYGPYSITGSTVTYVIEEDGNTITTENLNGAGEQGPIFKFNGDNNDEGFINATFSTPISNAQFKLADFDQREILTVNVYDENNDLIDLSDGRYITTLGTQISQSGNVFTEINSNNNVSGDDVSSDPLGSVLFNFEGVFVSRINISIEHQEGSSIRYTQINYCRSQDTDNDGIPDYKDTDSDNDNCPDAVEGSGNFTDSDLTNGFLTGADANNDGVIDAIATQDIGSSQNSAVQDPDCIDPCDAVASGNLDTDNDGVSDSCDLDDDNDGIIDDLECGGINNNTTLTISPSGSNPISGSVSSTGGYPVTASASGNTGSGSFPTVFPSSFNISATLGVGDVLDYSEIIFTSNSIDDGFSFSVNGTQILYFDQYHWDPTAGGFSGGEFSSGGKFDIDNSGMWTPWTNEGNPQLIIKDGSIEVLVDTNVNDAFGNPIRENALPYMNPTAPNAVTPFLVNESFTYNLFAIGGVDFEISNSNHFGPSGMVGLTITTNVYTCVDTDLDGIANYLDTDSDNDGCPDATEGASNLATTATLAGGSVGGSNANLGTTVNVNGIPIAATGGATTGTETTGQATNARVTASDVISSVAITSSPTPATICAGEDITFTATPTGIRVTDFGTTGATGDDTTIAIPSTDYIYRWYKDGAPGTTLSATSTLTLSDAVAADSGDYIVEVTTTNNVCPTEETVTLTVNPLPSTPVTTNVVYCVNDVAEALSDNVTGTTGTLNWYSDAAGNNSISEPTISTSSASGPTSYWVSQTDGNSCESLLAEITVTVNALPIITIDSKSDSNCVDGNVGAINITATGGAGSYTYAWTGPNSFSSSSEDLIGLAAGTYNLTVSDGNTCSVSISVEILESCLTVVKSNNSASGYTDTDLSGDVSVGDVVTYTYTVENTGTANLTEVTVYDDKLGAVTLTDVNTNGATTLAPDDIETGTLAYTIVAGDLDATITNIVTATSTQTPTPVADTNSITVASEIDAVDDDMSSTPVNGLEGLENITNVFTNDTLNGDPVDPQDVTLTEVTPDPIGVLTLNPDGSVDVAANSPAGTYTLTYRICENVNPTNCDTAVVTVVVVAPEIDAVDDDMSSTPVNGLEGLDNITNVFANDTLNGDPVDPQDVTLTEVTPDPIGVLTLNPDGSVDVAANSPAGTYYITYSICEVGDITNCDTAIVTVIVVRDNTVNAVTDFNNTYKNTPVVGNVLTNDFDIEGDIFIVTTETVTTTEGVVVQIDAITGEYTYTPPIDFVGSDSFEYTICDDGSPQACDTAVVYIEVIDEDSDQNPPVANPDTNITEVNVPVNGTVIVNDFDPDGDEIFVNVTPIVNPSNGTVVINPDGTYTYTPNTNFVGEDKFVYEICDSTGLCDTTTVTIIVLPDSGNITVANDDGYTISENEILEANVLGNDFDPEHDTQEVNVVIVVQPIHGTVVMNTDGSFRYIPNENYIGPDSFVYEVCDNGNPQSCDRATVYITIAGVLADCNIVFPGQENSEFEGYGFSPNGDGYNDVFKIENLELCYPNYQIEIFNRWGNIVFDYKHNGNSNNSPKWWDGTSYGRLTINKGEVLPVGTYFYIIYPNHENAKEVSGYIYLTK